MILSWPTHTFNDNVTKYDVFFFEGFPKALIALNQAQAQNWDSYFIASTEEIKGFVVFVIVLIGDSL